MKYQEEGRKRRRRERERRRRRKKSRKSRKEKKRKTLFTLLLPTSHVFLSDQNFYHYSKVSGFQLFSLRFPPGAFATQFLFFIMFFFFFFFFFLSSSFFFHLPFLLLFLLALINWVSIFCTATYMLLPKPIGVVQHCCGCCCSNFSLSRLVSWQDIV